MIRARGSPSKRRCHGPAMDTQRRGSIRKLMPLLKRAWSSSGPVKSGGFPTKASTIWLVSWKAIGYKENSEMSAWVYRARLQVSQSAVDANEVVARGQRAGWPFIQPWLDAGRQNCKLLSKEEARALLQDDSTPQRGDLRHPTTVMRLTVPELTMRTRLKRSIIHDTR